MSFRRVVIAITVAFALAFSANIAADTANACDPTSNGGYC
jgi:hypothetical protein